MLVPGTEDDAIVLINDCSNSSFSLFRSTERMYIDKSLLIKDILERNEDGRFLYTRPRRFGKTMNRSMLDCFFNMKYKGNDWFDGLKISEYHQFDVHKNRYPVISLDMTSICATNLNSFQNLLRSLIRNVFLEYSFLREDEKVNSADLVFFDDVVVNMNCNGDWIFTAIPELMRILHQYYGERVVVLIDEYDHGLITAAPCEDLEWMTKTMSTFLSMILKVSPHVKFAYLTGVSQLYRATLFSGVNNLDVDSVLDSYSGDRFGFTEDEVVAVLENIGHADHLDEVRRYYDGYRIGDCHVYNPFSIINYASKKRLEPYWVGTSDTNPIETMLNRMDLSNFESVYSLLSGGSVHSRVNNNFNYADLADPDFPKLVSFMIMTGYLTAVRSDDGLYDVYIPNEEVRQSVREILDDAIPLSNRNVINFVRAFIDQDVEGMVSHMENILSYHSYFDLRDETSYTIILMQVLSELITRYDVRTQVESGNGRVDIMLRPMAKGLPPMVIEVKRVKKEKKLGNALDQALEQIHDRRYTMGMEGDVTLMGFAFWGKVPAVRIEHITV